MANPTIFFDNVLEDGTLTAASSAEDSAYPLANVTDWRMGGPFRFRITDTGGTTIKVDSGGANLTCDTTAMAGHTAGTESASWAVAHSANDSDWTDSFTAEAVGTTDLPVMRTFTSAADRYWRIVFTGNPYTDPLQIGILTLGVRLDLEVGAQPDLDPYGVRAVTDESQSRTGSPIGVNVRYRSKQFNLSYPEPGMTKTGFYAPASGLTFDDDFIPHAIDSAKPFFFNWNITEDPTEVYLGWTRGVRMPFVGSTARRGLSMQIEGYREIA